jgi:non-ribosomal peptide synthetase component E (peptide arylation enzyme)
MFDQGRKVYAKKVLQATAGRHLDIIPGEKAIICGKKKVIGRELNNRINRLTNALMFLGIMKGN